MTSAFAVCSAAEAVSRLELVKYSSTTVFFFVFFRRSATVPSKFSP